MLFHLTPRVLIRPLVLSAGLGLCLASPVQAQLRQGFVTRANPVVTNEELVRQRDVWIMELELKPMRMAVVELKDPKTGEVRQEPVWYLAWRAIRRPVQGREREDVHPVNELDPLPGPRQFVPDFTLVTYDGPQDDVPMQILSDEILLPAMEEIRRIERGDFQNSVSVVRDLPEATPTNVEEQEWIYGAATWRGVDPRADFFRVILGGFSNAYELKPGPSDQQQVWQKVLVQRFSRPGDEFDVHQREFVVVGTPEWVYQPDSPPVIGPAADRTPQRR